MQESQLLFGETLVVHEEQQDWLRVEAVEQQTWTARGWRGYPGWVRRRDVAFVVEPPGGYDGVVQSAFTTVRRAPSPDVPPVLSLSLGTRLALLSESPGFLEVSLHGPETGWVPASDLARRTDLPAADATRRAAEAARLFLGTPYLWGGRSMALASFPDIATGVDCSGLVNLVFRVLHIDVPRNAHDQWIRARATTGHELRPGDLIYLSGAEGADAVTHVMLSTGGETFIEAPETGGLVREMTFSERFGMDLTGLEAAGLTANGRRLRFGRIID
jgi:cell wall-associated NlpC family hydrolase